MADPPTTEPNLRPSDSQIVVTGRTSGPDRSTTVRLRLSGLYFFYFAVLGALIPYLALYLDERGYSAREIGILFAIKVSARVLAPNLVAWYADRSGQRMRLVRLAAGLAVIAFTGMYLVDGFGATALVLGLWAFCFSAMLPQFEATALNHLGARQYGRVRVWGSVGFIVAVVALGALLGRYGTTVLLPALSVLLVGSALCALAVPDRDHPHAAAAGEGLWAVLRRPEVMALFAVGLFAQFAHGPYYSFFSLYLEGLGYSRATIGQMWALGVVAEVVVFLGMARLLARVGPQTLLVWSLALAVLRWVLLVMFADRIAVLAFAQVLHLASFGVFHAVSIGFVHRYFPGRLQGRGQALFSSLTFGAGSALGSLAAGFIWDGVAPAAVFVAAAAASATALLVAIRFRQRLAR